MKRVSLITRFAGTICMLFFVSVSLFAQHKGFNYQAIARDATQELMTSSTMTIHFSLLDNSEQLIWKEAHEVTTNEFGLFSLIILREDATRTGGSAATLDAIDWSQPGLSLKLEAEDGGNLVDLGTHPLTAVPYAMFALNGGGSDSWQNESGNAVFVDGKVGVGTSEPEGTLTIMGQDDTGTEPLFMVRRKDGYPVFAVYEHGVYAYTDTSDSKGFKGGFAVGGYKSEKKGIGQEYMRVTADSIRFYVQDPAGTGGGFAVGGYDPVNNNGNELFRITNDSIRFYIYEDSNGKGAKGGFAVGGYKNAKAENIYNEYFNISGKTEAKVMRVSEPRILWYPLKEAFLAGRVLIQSPDSVGNNSFSAGFESKAIGDFSQALGFKSIAAADYSTAIGRMAFARGTSSFALGDNALTRGSGSFAFGMNSKALNDETFAFGQDAKAKGLKSFAIGFNAEAVGEASYAIGQGTKAQGLGSLALGFVGKDSSDVATGSTVASANYSVAIGMGAQSSERGAFSIGTMTQANGPFAYAIGYRTISSGWYSLATGYNTEAKGNFSTAMGYGSSASGSHSIAIGQKSAASDWYAVAIGLSSRAEGQQSMALGAETWASSDYSVAIGKMSRADGIGALAIGFNTLANQYGVAIGYQTETSGQYATSMGFRSNASGINSFAVGNIAKAEGGSAVAMGNNTIASGASSFSMGQNTVADGTGAAAIGFLAQAAGNYSAAFGFDTRASGDWSFAAGQNTEASMWNTFAMGGGSAARGHVASAFGLMTIAKPFASFAVGQYNDTTCSVNGATSWVDTDPLFIVGNGSSMNNRRNAMTVLKNGEVRFPNAYGHTVGATNRDLYIDNTGKIGYVVSSQRYKEDIRDLDNMSWIYDLRPVTFHYIEDATHSMQYGLIAEEVEDVNADLVSYNSQGQVETVAYSKLLTPMLKALQEQNEQIRIQNERIEMQDEIIKDQKENLLQKDADIKTLKSRLDVIEKALEMK